MNNLSSLLYNSRYSWPLLLSLSFIYLFFFIFHCFFHVIICFVLFPVIKTSNNHVQIHPREGNVQKGSLSSQICPRVSVSVLVGLISPARSFCSVRYPSFECMLSQNTYNIAKKWGLQTPAKRCLIGADWLGLWRWRKPIAPFAFGRLDSSIMKGLNGVFNPRAISLSKTFKWINK